MAQKTLLKRLLPLLSAALLLPLPAAALWEPDARVGTEGLLRGQKRAIYALAVSRDGRYLASGSFDSTTRIWNTADWSVYRQLDGHSFWIGAVAFSPDGKTLAAGSVDQQIRIYTTKNWKLSKTLGGHSGQISALAYSPDGQTLASVSFNDLGVRLWDAGSGQLRHTLIDHSEEVYALAYSPDGKYLASGGADRIIRLWDTGTLLPVTRMAGHLKPIWSLGFAPTGKTLASGGIGDKTIRIWTVPQGANVQTLTKTSDKTFSLAFAPKGDALYSGHDDAGLRIWLDKPDQAAQSKHLQISLQLGGWNLAGQAQNAPGRGQQGELLLSLENKSSSHLSEVTAAILVKTPGVQLQTEQPKYFLARFEAGSRKKLALPLTIPADLQAEAIELEIRLDAPGAGQSLLPLRVPLRNNP